MNSRSRSLSMENPRDHISMVIISGIPKMTAPPKARARPTA
jgi:hypothetical protein